MKYIVNTPSVTFDGKRAGLQFRKGTTGEVELTDDIAKALHQAGYEVTEVKEKTAKPTKKSGK